MEKKEHCDKKNGSYIGGNVVKLESNMKVCVDIRFIISSIYQREK